MPNILDLKKRVALVTGAGQGQADGLEEGTYLARCDSGYVGFGVQQRRDLSQRRRCFQGPPIRRQRDARPVGRMPSAFSLR